MSAHDTAERGDGNIAVTHRILARTLVITEDAEERARLNVEIARALGFRAFGIRVNGQADSDAGWRYPEAFGLLEWGTPMRFLPDFVGIIEAGVTFARAFPGSDYRTGARTNLRNEAPSVVEAAPPGAAQAGSR